MIKILLLLFGALKFSKLFITGGTMLLSVGVYAFIFGWRYAAGFVLLLFVHEMGHFIAARQRGLNVSWPTFIPFMGAWIELKDMPHNAETEAYVGLAGPLVGTMGAYVCYALAQSDGNPHNWLMAVAYAGFFLNLFNMIPLSPFDGGRITAVLSPRLWLLGAPILGYMLWRNPLNPVLLFMLFLAVPQLIKAWNFRANDPAHQGYYVASTSTRIIYGAAYLALLLFLALMVHDVHELLVQHRPA